MHRPLRLTAVLAATAALAAMDRADAPGWQLQVSGTNVSLRGMSAVSETVAWTSGQRGTVRRTTDGGLTWQARPIAGAEMLDVRDVDAFSDRLAYALTIGAGEQSRIFKTTDGGDTWQTQFVNREPAGFFDAMAFWDAERGLAVSDTIDGRFYVVATTDGGSTWSRIAPDRFPPALPNEGYFAASGTNVAVWGTSHAWLATGAADTARVLRTTDGGNSWQVANTPLVAGPTSGIYSVAFRDATHGLVVGGNFEQALDATDNLAMTTDGGATWTLVRGAEGGTSALGGYRSVVAWVPGTEIAIAVGPSGADISTDGGSNWAPVEGPGFHTFAAAPGARVGWAAGSRGRIGKLVGF